MKSHRTSQQGMALIAVLWLVAAMGLIITGIVQAVRSEARSAGLQRHVMVASALGDAAILLALQNLHAQQKEPSHVLQNIPVTFERQLFEVKVQPLNGLIDINNATVVLLADLYRHGGGLNPSAAQALAQATVELRQSKGVKGTAQGFDAVEDLLRVTGMTYDLYAKINRLVTADLREGGGRVNPMLAPVAVLEVLTGGNVDRAAVMVAGRNADSKLMDTSFLKPELIEMASSRSLQLQVRIGLPDGGSMQKTWQVFWGADPRSGLPWRVYGTRQAIQQVAQSDI